MVLVTKEQHPVVDSCCSHAIHPGRQFPSLSPGIVPEAVYLRAVQEKPFKSSRNNQVLMKKNYIFMIV